MLELTGNFTADQVRFLQTEATEFLLSTDKSIIDAANNGLSEVLISKWDNDKNDYYTWAASQEAIMAHYENRGFKVVSNGMSSIIISW